ncbi:AAA family ATPase [Candidatus Desantisbacteria bacterium]|nr:AAA family ATPase [Candidatus Desantisbacteria bacterium]
MITKIGLKGFKLHGSTSITASPITIFIGPNNSGKSSLVQAIQALCQTNPNNSIFLPTIGKTNDNIYRYLPNTYKVDLGNFKDVIRQGNEYVHIRLEGSLPKITMDFQVKIKNNMLCDHEGFSRALEEDMEIKWEYMNGGISNANLISSRYPCEFSPKTTFQLISFNGITLTSSSSRDQQEYHKNLGQIIGNSPRDLLSTCQFSYPLRGFEESGYFLPGQPPEKCSMLENITLNDRTTALIAAFAYNASLRKEVAEKLSDIMGVNYDIDVQWIGDNRVQLLLKQPTNTLMVNEGTGLQQMIAFLVQLILVPDNSTVFIAEPEAHLHPRSQVEMGRLLLKFFKKKKIQLFIETHSEHLLHAFLHAILRQELQRDELSVCYFENKDGNATITQQEIDELGRVKGGFSGFFEQSLQELTEFLEAIGTK